MTKIEPYNIWEQIAETIIQTGNGKDILNHLADRLMTEQVQRDNYLLYLGVGEELTEDLKNEIADIVSGFTDSFTLATAIGFFKKQEEKTVLIQIASENKKIAYECAEALRDHFNQKGVGVVKEVKQEGSYRRVIQEQ
ncbi:MAG: hypothetical protein JJ953_11745 [Gracilimonas sp.]|uniref:hypothetical protein n=1 Tax=Gracilimonas sp. TaxID=1974203 RepID=UPI001B08FA1B|nr:hypothetical protein [Gracilimonas sp.]MBO6586771.1 hypothetical protein [Gracilimonas sp.]MBO6615428.1 hypothetical protein [Gracilimonas sp.]